MATQSSMVTPSMGMKGTTSAAPMRGCAPWCRGEVDQLRGLADAANGGFLDGVALADQRDHAAIVVGIHFAIEKKDAGNLHGFDDGVDLGRIPAFRKIGNTFNQRVRHRLEDNDRHREAATRESTYQLPASKEDSAPLPPESTVDCGLRCGAGPRISRV